DRIAAYVSLPASLHCQRRPRAGRRRRTPTDGGQIVVTKQQVISPERYASALSYDGFIAQAEKNLDEFKDNYENTKVSDAQKQRLKAVVAKPNGPKKLLVLGEDWCPDVYRGLPV